MPQGPFPPGGPVTVPGFPALSPQYVPVEGLGSGGAVDVSFFSLPGNATGTITLSGAIANGNTATATINGSATNVTASGDTLNSLAAKLATAINANAAVNTLVTATSSGAVVTITAIATGGTGYYSLTASSTGALVTTASYTSLELPGVVVPLSTFSYAATNSAGAMTFYYNMPAFVDAATKAELRAQGRV